MNRLVSGVCLQVLGKGEGQKTSIPLDRFVTVVINESEVLGFYQSGRKRHKSHRTGFVGLVVPMLKDDSLLSVAGQARYEIVTSKELQMWRPFSGTSSLTRLMFNCSWS